MTGPDHYVAAEELLAQVTSLDGIVSDATRHANTIAAAQVHATLAKAAATALVANDDPPPRDAEAWFQAAGSKA